MKIAICGDVHWSQYSSIVRRRGEKYSTRLENLINSVNWFNSLAVNNNCELAVYMGDFFDKSELVAEEISALKEIKWAPINSYFICGNHEMMSVDHKYSSAKIFDLLETGTVSAVPELIYSNDNIELYSLPYILETNRNALESYFPARNNKKRIILSHNDIAGVQMGKFVSEAGFHIDEIHANCDLFINGHLHNGEKVDNTIINIGNLTGQNFSENAFQYDHVVFILDTETLKIEVFENPYAFNFYKIDATSTAVTNLDNLKSNAVVTLKCLDSKLDFYKKKLSELTNVAEYRTIIQADIKALTESLQEEVLTVDHLASFKEYMLSTLENTKELMEELNEVLK